MLKISGVKVTSFDTLATISSKVPKVLSRLIHTWYRTKVRVTAG